MAKINKEDLVKKISEKVTDEDLAIELMEDISDSFEDVDTESIKSEYESKIAELTAELEDVKRKYKERFTDGSKVEEPKVEEKIEDEELEEKEVIDINEI